MGNTKSSEKATTAPTNRWNDPKWLRKELKRAEAANSKRSEARAALPPGSSRARVTSANAAWSRAAEYRDLVGSRLAALEAALANRVDDCEAPVVSVRVVAMDVEGDDATVSAALRLAVAAIEGSES